MISRSTVLHCVADADLEEHQRELAELVAGMSEKFPDVHVTRQLVRRRRVADGILEHQGADRDLVVVGEASSCPSAGRGIATLAGTVIEHGACAVAVVPTLD